MATRQRPQCGFLTLPLPVGQGFRAGLVSERRDARRPRRPEAGPAVRSFSSICKPARNGRRLRPPLRGSGWPGWTSGTLILSMLDRSSAPTPVLAAVLSRGRVQPPHQRHQPVRRPQPDSRPRALVAARNEASFSIWTSDATATRWTQTIPTTPAKGPDRFRGAMAGDDLVTRAWQRRWRSERWRASTHTTETSRRRGHTAGEPRRLEIVFFDYDTGELWKTDANGRNKAQVGRRKPAGGSRPMGGRSRSSMRPRVRLRPSASGRSTAPVTRADHGR